MDDAPVKSSRETQRLLEDLQLHQRELEMQNEILREAQHDLSASRDAFAALYDLAPGGVLTINAEGVVCQANQAALQLFTGYDGDLVGRHLFSFVCDNQRSQIIEQIVAARRGMWPSITVEVLRSDGLRKALRLDGRVCPSFPLPDGQRRNAILVVATDITQLLVEQEALRKAKAAAEAATRAKGEFLSVMSHEIRTPLNGIIGMNAVLLDMGLDAHVMEMLHVVKTSGEDLLRVLNDVLDMSRIEAGKVTLENTLFDLHALLEDISTLYAPLAHAARIELVLVMDPTLPRRAIGDGGRLRQVVQNLIGNAVKFTHQGEVVLEVMVDPGAGVRFAVKDSGIGMDAETLQRIFTPFTQADMSASRHYGGSGLGLSISHRLVQLMGSELKASSSPGKGTTMEFVLPISTDAAPTPPALLAGHTVMLIDHHDRSRAATEALLRSWNMEVISAPTIPLARQFCATRCSTHNLPLACIMDDQALDERGEQPCMCHKDQPILLGTSGANEQHLHLLAKVGVSAILSRPIRPSRLAESLLACVQGSSDELAAAKLALHRGWPRRKAVVVDDHPVTRLVLRRMLEQYGFVVSLAANGQQGADLVISERPDFALVDIRMPDCDGPTMARAVRMTEAGSSHHVPLIACSATTQDGERSLAIEAGMDAWLSKPVRVGELLDIIERHLGPPEEFP